MKIKNFMFCEDRKQLLRALFELVPSVSKRFPKEFIDGLWREYEPIKAEDEQRHKVWAKENTRKNLIKLKQLKDMGRCEETIETYDTKSINE